jgi:hypothetical protein
MRIASPSEKDRIDRAVEEYLAKGGVVQQIREGAIASEYFVRASAMDQENWDAHMKKLAAKDARLIGIIDGLLGTGVMKCDMVRAAGSTIYKVNRVLKLFFKNDPRAAVYLGTINKKEKR